MNPTPSITPSTRRSFLQNTLMAGLSVLTVPAKTALAADSTCALVPALGQRGKIITPGGVIHLPDSCEIQMVLPLSEGAPPNGVITSITVPMSGECDSGDLFQHLHRNDWCLWPTTKRPHYRRMESMTWPIEFLNYVTDNAPRLCKSKAWLVRWTPVSFAIDDYPIPAV